MQALLSILQSQGYDFLPEFTGEYIRSNRNDKILNAWFFGTEAGGPKGPILEAKWGDWATGERHEWRSDTETTYSPEDLEKIKQINAANQKLLNQKREEIRKQAQKECQEEYSKARPLTNKSEHPYLQTKTVYPGNARLNGENELLIPIFKKEQLVSLQRILPNGKKLLWSGGQKAGCYMKAGEGAFQDTVYITEGFSTGASVAEAINGPVLVAIDKGNLVILAQDIPFPCKKVVICADNDQWGDPTKGNPGIDAAKKALTELTKRGFQVEIRFPEFTGAYAEITGVDTAKKEVTFTSIKPTDWNDFHCLYGLEALQKEISKELAAPPKLLDAGAQGQKTEVEKKKKGKNEKKISEMVLEIHANKLVRQEENLLSFQGTKWVELFEQGKDNIKNQINTICGDKLDSKDVNSAYRTFFRYVPSVPQGVNIFLPRPDCINFQDGTLHLRRNLKTNKYTTEFLPHNPEDYLMWCHPFKYKEERSRDNPLWKKLLDDAFLGDPEKEEKILSLKQMAGAMLVPAFHQFFFLTGVSGSRKSTITKTIIKPLQAGGWDNVSFMDPSLMEGFHLENMAGRLVNVNTDIDDQIPIPRGIMKRFEDNLPFPINRKNKTVINSILPMVHIYCANDLPPNYEKSKALQRRITIIEFKNDLTNGPGAEAPIKYYEDVIWAAGQGAILEFALEGLDLLLASGGNFTKPASSNRRLGEWQDMHNPVSQFLQEIKDGEYSGQGAKIVASVTEMIGRGALYEAFAEWQKGKIRSVISRSRFYLEMDKTGYLPYRDEKGRYYCGLSFEGKMTDVPV